LIRTTKPDLAEQLRQAIVNSGLSQHQIAERSGVAQPHVSRFVSGARATVTLQTASKLAAALGLRLAPEEE